MVMPPSAVARALPMLRPAHSLSIVRMPAGLDPDDLIRDKGVTALEELLGGELQHEIKLLLLLRDAGRVGVRGEEKGGRGGGGGGEGQRTRHNETNARRLRSSPPS